MDQLLNAPEGFRSGHIVVLGRPNTGKSTLFNALVGERLSIATDKPQTTRKSILGIFTTEKAQMMFLDTPGLLDPAYRLHELMRNEIDTALEGADIILCLADASDLDRTFDSEVIKAVSGHAIPVVVALNKCDLVPEEQAASSLDRILDLASPRHVLAVSALAGTDVIKLRERLEETLPLGPRFYPEDVLTEQPERFFCEELIREEIFNRLRQELPYAIAVQVESFDEDRKKIYIKANVIVERNSQKGIVIGKGGRTLRDIGKNARGRIEKFLQHPVYLDLHVKVIQNWRKKDTALRNLGYG
ncbi:MAG: GTPase Era [Gemmatimonadetes bacterium]|nr:GTPase Era [Gemmatimonadota bacterium]